MQIKVKVHGILLFTIRYIYIFTVGVYSFMYFCLSNKTLYGSGFVFMQLLRWQELL